MHWLHIFKSRAPTFKSYYCHEGTALKQHRAKEGKILPKMMYNSVLWKSCSTHTVRFLKQVWPFFNITNLRVNVFNSPGLQRANKDWSWILIFCLNELLSMTVSEILSFSQQSFLDIWNWVLHSHELCLCFKTKVLSMLVFPIMVCVSPNFVLKLSLNYLLIHLFPMHPLFIPWKH